MTSIEWSELSVLVVDDEPPVREIIAGILRQLGCRRILQAGNASMALARLRADTDTPDCVILDIRMPGMNGIELAYAIRTDPRIARNGMPIVMLTGISDRDMVVAAKALDVCGFILKPASRSTIARRLEQSLSSAPEAAPPDDYLECFVHLPIAPTMPTLRPMATTARPD